MVIVTPPYDSHEAAQSPPDDEPPIPLGQQGALVLSGILRERTRIREILFDLRMRLELNMEPCPERNDLLAEYDYILREIEPQNALADLRPDYF